MKIAIMVLSHIEQQIKFYKAIEAFSDKERLDWIERTVADYMKILEETEKKNCEEAKVGGTD